ncbi:MAG: ABC transporter permease [Acidimicrobiales bacterium]
MMPPGDAPNQDDTFKERGAVQADVVQSQLVEAPMEVTEAGEAGGVGGLGKIVWGVFAENKLALVSIGIVVFMLLFCFVGPHIYVTNQTTLVVTSVGQVLAHPGAQYPLGTDPNGYNILGRLMFGGATTLEIALLAAGIATVFGVCFGAISGYVGGVTDAVMMRIVDTILSVPTLFLLVVLAAILRPSFWLIVVIVALAAWLVPARLIRGESLTLRTREYVQAVRAMGGGGARIVARHIIPNAVGTIIVNATFQLADAIGVLAALGFLGFGVPAPGTSWGQMLSQGITYAQAGDWWLIYPAGVFIILITVSFNYIGDALRDAFEVRLQRR